ncbi:50S ribosomal protein L7ae [Candidatus Woesearchaeota archaeon]|nr:50S ribosomal protein L7ae [Candidatus Woesearchaeota archaeon]|tara:strand:- start:8 stop:436 length:429 start_codon:yes stop_codon:yes gene_type:complete
MDSAYEAVELAAKNGKIKKGTNEVTKAIEKGKAKLVVIAKDISPPEITMHLPLLSKEKGIECVEVDSKEELGAAAGLPVGTAAIAVLDLPGGMPKQAKSKPKKEVEAPKEEAKPEAPKEAPKEEAKPEAPKEESKTEEPKGE